MATAEPAAQTDRSGKRGIFQRMLDGIEKTGNALPHPVTLFALLAAAVVLISGALAATGITVESPLEGEGTLTVNSLMDSEGIAYLFTSFVDNFINFAPLGVVLASMVGIGIAEQTGLISAALRGFIFAIPRTLITFGIVFAGIMSSLATDAGYVVLPPIAAMLFLAVGRHPVAGIAAAFAGVSAGFSANLLLSPLDALLGNLTIEGARTIDPAYADQMNIAMNYYMIIVSTVFLAIIGTLVSQFIVEPRLGTYAGPGAGGLARKGAADADADGTATADADVAVDTDAQHEGSTAAGEDDSDDSARLTPLEKKGLMWAGVAFLVTGALLSLLVLPPNAPLRGEGGSIVDSPFLSSLVVTIIIMFFVPGLVYGIVTGSVKNDEDVAKHLSKSMAGMSLFLLLAFTAGQFVAYFSESRLGTFLAVYGAEFLQNIGLTGIPLLLAFILIVALINLFIGSASAKWAILAPVFVPIMMQ
ncbi:MAG: AbgT family transporter, partial [Mobilicoccus sp.]|nr:AbgT family transporter [Mobilicoccus sp.]